MRWTRLLARAAALPSWHEPETVLSLATAAVAEREGHEAAHVRDRLSGLAGAEAVEFFEMPRLDVSSTLVRERAREGRPLRHLVPAPVLEAMSMGVPVACSDIPVLHEVGGDVPEYFDPTDPAAAAAALDGALAARGRDSRGPARAAGFSWAEAARGTMEAYERALRARRS